MKKEKNKKLKKDMNIRRIGTLAMKYSFLIAILIIVCGIFVLPKIPYINLLSIYTTGFIIWFAVIIGCKFKPDLIIKVGLILILCAMIAVLMGKDFLSEQLGSAIFLTVLSGVVIKFVKSYHERSI